MPVNKITWYNTQVNHLLRSQNGDVGQWLKGEGHKVMALAKVQAGYKTGRLKQSIQMHQSRTPDGQQLKIGSSVHYAYLHHEGTKPHVIVPRRANQLVFMSYKSGRAQLVRTQIVHHPGTRANHYLTDPMIAIFPHARHV